MKMRMNSFTCALAIIITCFIYAGIPPVHGAETPFPVYGSGPIQVQMYTDYFCPPCRAMEPAVEPLLIELVKNDKIRLTLVDVPLSRISALYARYFLYALKTGNSFEQALKVRNILFIAADQRITMKEKIEELFKSKKIPYTPFEPKPVFARFNTLIRDDGVNATPSCVIVRNGKKEKFVGGDDIIKALKGLK